MKIVINKCYGGFSLSPFAVKRLAELNNKPCFFFIEDRRVDGSNRHNPVNVEDIGTRWSWSAYAVPNPDEAAPSQDNWYNMSLDEKRASNEAWEAITLEQRPQDRADPLLVQVVEELGEKANGSCSELRVIEIPDDIEWEIDEYDGMESVNEKHRSWN